MVTQLALFILTIQFSYMLGIVNAMVNLKGQCGSIVYVSEAI